MDKEVAAFEASVQTVLDTLLSALEPRYSGSLPFVLDAITILVQKAIPILPPLSLLSFFSSFAFLFHHLFVRLRWAAVVRRRRCVCCRWWPRDSTACRPAGWRAVQSRWPTALPGAPSSALSGRETCWRWLRSTSLRPPPAGPLRFLLLLLLLLFLLSALGLCG